MEKTNTVAINWIKDTKTAIEDYYVMHRTIKGGGSCFTGYKTYAKALNIAQKLESEAQTAYVTVSGESKNWKYDHLLFFKGDSEEYFKNNKLSVEDSINENDWEPVLTKDKEEEHC